MFGWLSLASAWASRANRSAKAGVAADLRRQDLQRHQAVELLLPGLVDRAHAAPADEFQDLQLGKEPGELLDVGGTKGSVGDSPGPESVVATPISTRLPRPPFIRHSGQSPWGALAGTGRWQPGQICSVSMIALHSSD